jgi:hypothetical protein
MAVYLSAQEKADISKEACSENCLIHVQNYFGTRNGLVDHFFKFLHRFKKSFCRVVLCYFFYIYIFLYCLGVKMDNEYFICFWLLNFPLNIFPKIGFRQNVLSHFFSNCIFVN